MKNGIFIYTKRNRKSHIKLTLYFLFKNYNSEYKNPVYILSTDLNKDDKEEILLGIRNDCRNLINFKDIKLENPIIDNNIDKSLKYNITKDWDKIGERNLNYYMLYTFWEEIGNEFDYILKMNDDVLIEEPIKDDLFKILDNRANNLLFCTLTQYCPYRSFGIKDYLKANFSEDNEKIDSIFNEIKISDDDQFKLLYKLIFNKEYQNSTLQEPTIPNDNLMVIRTSFIRDKIKLHLNKIKDLKYIYYFNWSFNLIVSLLALLINPDKVTRCVFKISEEKHRSSYIEDGKIISNVPDNYKLSGCVSKK